jgi:hypothetical protein
VELGNSVASIGREAFAGCTSLSEITIPDSVITVSGSAFADCTSLISIMIPDSVTNLEPDVFVGCTSLISIAIGNGVTSVWSYMFRGCTNLNAITVGTLKPGLTGVDGVLFNKRQTKLIQLLDEIGRREVVRPHQWDFRCVHDDHWRLEIVTP